MGSFGENLRREREMRSVTLEEISDATKISLRALQALEAEEFTKLPGGIFNRSFVRTYARYLGLDEDKVMTEYLAVCPKSEDVDLKHFNPVKAASQKETPRGRLMALTLALTLLAAGYALYSYSRQRLATPPREASSAGSASPSVLPPAPGTGAPSTSTEGPDKLAPGQTGPTPAKSAGSPAAPAGGTALLLQVAATERAWVAVDADGKPAFQRILNPHDIQTVKATTSFDFVTGNAQGVILTLNGETLKPLGQRGEFKKLHLTRDDVKIPAP
jgi:cytoskeleton protein RodZ